MTLRATTAKNPPTSPSTERRLQNGAWVLARVARALRGLIRRPVGIYRVDGRWRAGLVERRRAPDDALALRGILDDLQERLLTQDPDFATGVLDHLVQVYDQMRSKGWAGVAALPDAVRSRALFQARMLARRAPSEPMTRLIDRLSASQPAQASSERSSATERDGVLAHAGTALEVSELSSDEFEASQRGWLDTVPPLHPPAPAAKERSP